MIILRKLTEKDSEILWDWRNNNRSFFVHSDLITHYEQENWFKEYLQNMSDLMYIVYLDDRPVGALGLYIKNGEAEIQRVMLGAKSFERKGVMSKALDQLMNAFGFNKYWLSVLLSNKEAIAFYKKNGFVIKGKDDCCLRMEKSYDPSI